MVFALALTPALSPGSGRIVRRPPALRTLGGVRRFLNFGFVVRPIGADIIHRVGTEGKTFVSFAALCGY
jgi:hypothetical protein